MPTGNPPHGFRAATGEGEVWREADAGAVWTRLGDPESGDTAGVADFADPQAPTSSAKTPQAASRDLMSKETRVVWGSRHTCETALAIPWLCSAPCAPTDCHRREIDSLSITFALRKLRPQLCHVW
jgi:hypothetical protein